MAPFNPFRRVRASDLDNTGAGVISNYRGAGARRMARLVNQKTGAGTEADKGLASDFQAKAMTREQAERLYEMSWAAAKMVDIKVDDMWVRGRRWTGDDEGAIEAMKEAEADLDVGIWLPAAMKAGRLFGTALLVICDERGEFDRPIEDASRDISEGSLTNLWVVDCWSCSVETWVTNQRVKGYGLPYTYRVSGRVMGSPDPMQSMSPLAAAAGPAGQEPTGSQQLIVHRDRIIRFDGIRSPLTEGWIHGPFQREWGLPILIRAVDDILRDASTVTGVGHLVEEASVWVQKIQGFKEAILGRQAEDEPSAEEIAEMTNSLRSLYRTTFIDAEDDAERLHVVFSGVAEIMDLSLKRMAAIEGIPVTRFVGTSAVGLNATGEGDARDWRITIAALQNKTLNPILRRFDRMIAAHAGLSEPPDFEWLPLGELTETEAATVLKTQAEALMLYYNGGTIDENEVRERAARNEFIGTLGEFAPSESQLLQEEMELERQATEIEVMKKPPQPPGSGSGGAE